VSGVRSERFEIESTSGEGDARVITMRVPHGSRFFEGHFEGMPMLPGVAQLVAIAHREAERVFGALGAPRRIARVKFQDVIVPGDRLSVSLARESTADETRVRFEITRVLADELRVASSGTIAYGIGG